MDVHRREKNADLLPVTRRRRARFHRARDFHLAVRRRQHDIVAVAPIGNTTLRIAEEEREKCAERDERDRVDPRDRRAGEKSEGERPADERRARRIETQLGVLHAIAADDVLHPILQLQLLLLEGDFFELFGF